MSQVILDIGPTQRNITKGDINFSKSECDIEGYEQYEYVKSEKRETFNLFFLYYDEQPLRGILPYPISVTSIITYFRKGEDKLLLIHISLKVGANWYCITPDTTTDVEDNTFTRFIVDSGKVLNTGDIGNILQNIDTNKGLNLIKLKGEQNDTAKKLVSSSDIIFDLTKTKIGYSSECSGTNISVIPGKVGTYQKVQHNPTYSPFCVKGIKLDGSQYMKVKGGLPNEGLTEFNVYYKDTNYTTPLLVELKAESQSIDGGSYFPSKYLLSKNTKDGGDKKWDIRKIGSIIDERTELEQVLRSISENDRLDIDNIDNTNIKHKLGDINKGVVIDLTKCFEKTNGINTKHYDSDLTRIIYKTIPGTYHAVKHAHFPSFTLKSITTSISTELGEENLPPPGTEIWQLQVYCTDSEYKRPILIEVICKYEQSDGCPKYAYYYSNDGDKTWNGYLLSTQFKKGGAGEDFADTENLIKHVKQNADKVVFEKLEGNLKGRLTKYTPEASVDRKGGITFYLTKKPKGTSGRSYQTTYYSSRKNIKVTSAGNSISGYHRVKHEVSGGSFSVRSITLQDKQIMQVSGGFPGDSFTNFFVYYSKENDTQYNKPLLITLTISNVEEDSDESNPDIYLLVKPKEGIKWDRYRIKFDKKEDRDVDTDLKTILQNISQGKVDFEGIKRKLKINLTKYIPDNGQTSSKETGAAKPLYKTVLEGFGGSGAGGGAAWEGYNLLLNPDRSLVMRLIRIFRVLL